jgi:hypothetical protein
MSPISTLPATVNTNLPVTIATDERLFIPNSYVTSITSNRYHTATDLTAYMTSGTVTIPQFTALQTISTTSIADAYQYGQTVTTTGTYSSNRILVEVNGVMYNLDAAHATSLTYDNWGNVQISCGKSRADIFREELRKKMAPAVISNRFRTLVKITPSELKARETLRDMILESEYRRYITNGFVMVKAIQSSRWYQIFNDRQKINVYEDGKKVCSLCIHTDDSCPPTDHIINMKLLAEIDEEKIWASANSYPVDNYKVPYLKRSVQIGHIPQPDDIVLVNGGGPLTLNQTLLLCNAV